MNQTERPDQAAQILHNFCIIITGDLIDFRPGRDDLDGRSA